MEAEKRKREDNGEVEVKKVKAEECNGGKSVTDTEVDEFYAILRRIHVAVKYFGKDDGASRELTVRKKGSWNPSFVLEDFVEDNGVKLKDDEKREGCEEGNSGLDLNLNLTFKAKNI
uniref:Protein NIM1-INTERACTING 2 n=1 Tax=Fagus sylvatica TaxID=28930 RepID=A0A2N9GER1_FAGSY